MIVIIKIISRKYLILFVDAGAAVGCRVFPLILSCIASSNQNTDTEK